MLNYEIRELEGDFYSSPFFRKQENSFWSLSFICYAYNVASYIFLRKYNE